MVNRSCFTHSHAVVNVSTRQITQHYFSSHSAAGRNASWDHHSVCMLDLGSHGWTMSMRVKTAVLCHPPLRYLPVRGADVSLACVICQDTKRLVESAHGSKFTDSGPSQCQQATDLWVLTPSLQRPNGGQACATMGIKLWLKYPAPRRSVAMADVVDTLTILHSFCVCCELPGVR